MRPAAPVVVALAALAPAAAVSGGPRTVASGTLPLPAAQAFGEPGFHQVLTATARVPSRLGRSAGMKIVLTLRDVTRPRQTCSQDHPLSGCATVDWSDDPLRPNVPQSGVFINSVDVRLKSESRTYYLSENGTLARRPDRFQPG